jgi:hypothetical protein
MQGHIVPTEDPSFWGQSVPLTNDRKAAAGNAPAMYAGAEKKGPMGKRVMLRRGRNFLGINPDNIFEEKE